jgi:hypothetical protein
MPRKRKIEEILPAGHNPPAPKGKRPKPPSGPPPILDDAYPTAASVTVDVSAPPKPEITKETIEKLLSRDIESKYRKIRRKKGKEVNGDQERLFHCFVPWHGTALVAVVEDSKGSIEVWFWHDCEFADR